MRAEKEDSVIRQLTKPGGNPFHFWPAFPISPFPCTPSRGKRSYSQTGRDHSVVEILSSKSFGLSDYKAIALILPVHSRTCEGQHGNRHFRRRLCTNKSSTASRAICHFSGLLLQSCCRSYREGQQFCAAPSCIGHQRQVCRSGAREHSPW